MPTEALADLADEDLVVRAREAASDGDRDAALGVLYGRFQPRLAAWCLRFSGDRDQAADLAQEVFLRLHEKLHTFRGESRFSTWLYTLARRVAINRGQSAQRRRADSLDDLAAEPAAPGDDAETLVAREQVLAAFRDALRNDLEPLEARVLYLHYVDGMTLPAITQLLALDNASGAKAYIVAGRRKLERRFGKWLSRAGGLA
jgi:RNA polymerase sigma factor (sigma-70 family)